MIGLDIMRKQLFVDILEYSTDIRQVGKQRNRK